MRRAALALFVAALLLAPGGERKPLAAAGPVVIEVTSAADGPGSCPGLASCTLRAAIASANALPAGTPASIRFSPASFPLFGATIFITQGPLPPLTADDAVIDGGGLPVVVDGSLLPGPALQDGIVLAGARTGVRGLTVREFSGTCVVLSGASSAAGSADGTGGLTVGRCQVGIAASGQGAAVYGSLVGFDSGLGAAPVALGVDVIGNGVTVGPPGGGQQGRNTVGHAATGIRIGGPPASAHVVVRGNVIGSGPAGQAAPVGVGVLLAGESSQVVVRENRIAHTTGPGISVSGVPGTATVTGAEFSGNTFEEIGTLPVDLLANGGREPNDPEDSDTGPNGLQNYPVLTRPTMGGVSGTVPGCHGCRVELYVAEHRPGDVEEHSFVPLATTGTTAPDGSFLLPGAGLVPGTWIAALATGPDGSGEMGPSARVGVGSVTCGAVALAMGWNHAPYLGTPVALGDHFPEGGAGQGAVTAIYELIDGPGATRHWFADSSAPRTLTALVPGATYWFLAERPVTLAGDFSVTSPFAVELSPGWNDFVYLGAPADTRDVFRGIAGGFIGPYRYEAGNPGTWEWGGPGTPSWALAFTGLTPCATYHVYADEAFSLLPPQP